MNAAIETRVVGDCVVRMSEHDRLPLLSELTELLAATDICVPLVVDLVDALARAEEPF